MSALTKETKEKEEKYLKESECASTRSLLLDDYDEDGYYIGPPSEYNENGIDTRIGKPFYGIRFDN